MIRRTGRLPGGAGIGPTDPRPAASIGHIDEPRPPLIRSVGKSGAGGGRFLLAAGRGRLGSAAPSKPVCSGSSELMGPSRRTISGRLSHVQQGAMPPRAWSP